MIHKEEVLEFLYSHRGWIKKSPKDLVARLENLNMPTDIDDVRKLQAEARQKIKYSHPSDANGITSDMKVKKVWFTCHFYSHFGGLPQWPPKIQNH